MPAFEMNALPPSITYPSESRTARVAMPAGSEPASGSVRAKAVIARPAATSGSQRGS